MNGFTTFLRRYGLLVLWLAFAPLTAIAARQPGFVHNPETVLYPWIAALLTWGILGIESALFYYFVVRSARGIRFAFLIAALLMVACAVTTVTDMPGYYYVPLRYQFVLTVSLGVAWLSGALGRRLRGSGSGGTAA